MKYLLLLLSFAAVRPITAQELPGLVAYWKMDGNCALTDEITESSSHGVLTDVSLTQNRDHVANSALLFQSATSYISMGAVEKLKLATDKSISFWINPVLSGSNRTGSVLVYGTGIIIRYEEQSAATRLNIIFGNTSYMLVNLVQNQWQPVTITFQKDYNATKSRVICYVNGLQVAEAQQNKSVHDFNNSIALVGPANQNTLTNGFRGSLDDLKIYNRTLTGEEVLGLALPVKLDFFRGKKVNGVVELSWKTTMEDGVSHFELMKSPDGINFQKISEVNAGKYNYTAYDVSVSSSPFAWYRLQIVDIDGKTTVSNIIKVGSENTLEPGRVLKIFPNPGSDYINFIGVPANGYISIVNSSGTIVKRKNMSGGNSVSISDLAPGLYYFIVFDGSRKTTSKFIKQ